MLIYKALYIMMHYMSGSMDQHPFDWNLCLYFTGFHPFIPVQIVWYLRTLFLLVLISPLFVICGNVSLVAWSVLQSDCLARSVGIRICLQIRHTRYIIGGIEYTLVTSRHTHIPPITISKQSSGRGMRPNKFSRLSKIPDIKYNTPLIFIK